MIFVFEDLRNDLLSRLFISAYNEESFIYTEGAGNLVNTVSKLLLENSEPIVVYIDTIPDNRETVRVYNNLRVLSKKNDFRVIVFPIVCAEYYFIKSLPEYVFLSLSSVNKCKNKEFWGNSDLVESEADKKFVKNFEKYCKLILLKNVFDCVKHTRNSELYGYYYTKDCWCGLMKDACKPERLLNKSLNYVYQYPVYPSKNFKGSGKTISLDDAWLIHRTLVDEFNAMVNLYQKNDITKAYSKIAYIQK